MEIEKRNVDKYFAINRKMVFSTNSMFSIIFVINFLNTRYIQFIEILIFFVFSVATRVYTF